jgi:hypothetical protein
MVVGPVRRVESFGVVGDELKTCATGGALHWGSPFEGQCGGRCEAGLPREDSL